MLIKVDNHNNVDEVELVKNDKVQMMIILHPKRKLESLVVVLAKRRANDREDNDLSLNYPLFCLYILLR